MSQTIGGRYEVRGPQRETRLGVWHALSDQDGQPRGGLRLNTLNDAESQRLGAVLQATAEAPGLLGVIDQQEGWLITAVPATPTLAQALAARVPLPEAVALLIGVDVAETLAALHNSSLAHGNLSTDSVVLSGQGNVFLAESGYAHALAGTTPGPGHDVNAWSRLLRELAAPRPQDTARQLLTEAADRAESIGGSAGLGTALADLSARAAAVGGYGERSAVAMLAALLPQPSPLPSPEARPAPHAQQQAQPQRQSAPEDALTVRVPDDVTTVPANGSAATVPAQPNTPAMLGHTAVMPDIAHQETLQPAQLDAHMERKKDEVLRFGRGVASLPQPRPVDTAPIWQEQEYSRPKRPNRWRTRLIAALTTLTTLVLLAIVAYQVIQRLRPLEISGATVTLAEELGERCDVEARVVGVIGTNGAGGTITYRWVTSDGKTTSVLSEQVNLGTDQVEVPLLWRFSGKRTYDAKATLQILTPRQMEASKDFTYTCK